MLLLRLIIHLVFCRCSFGLQPFRHSVNVRGGQTASNVSTKMSENKGPMALAAVIVISAVSTTFTAARLFTRGTVMGKLMLDDYLILAAVVSNP